MTKTEAIRILGLSLAELEDSFTQGKDLCLQLIKDVYHKQAQVLHPDHGGDPALFYQLKEAAATLRALVQSRAQACQGCGGAGEVVIQEGSGFYKPLTRACRWCKGRGVT